TIALSSSAGATIDGDLVTDGGTITLSTRAGATINGNLLAGAGTVTVAVDTNDDEAATLRMAGTVAAAAASFAGSAAGDDVLEGSPSVGDGFVLSGASAGTLNGVGFTGFGAVAGLG